jgi:hypothetical protein
MPMSGAERQRRYRERHHGDVTHITLDVRVGVRNTSIVGRGTISAA